MFAFSSSLVYILGILEPLAQGKLERPDLYSFESTFIVSFFLFMFKYHLGGILLFIVLYS